ncbi:MULTISPECIES: carboxymuconolactone decarboxylase family protein [unclassified Burkholderia]|uniref:carboxymuconolactone decarboxylase family protein n=1 Tax=unclassified Burkholderia TaxID=2613784 RepID=UPI002AB277AB|nr:MULTISPECIES: carboxymuconolactone decarboxylase family protein [unclassified Burkholderia]
MPRIDVVDDPQSWMELQPELAAGLNALSHAVYGKSRLPMRVREAARMRIAEANECQLCRNTRDAQGQANGVDDALYEHVVEWRTWPGYSERERLAIEFAERFALDHVALSADDDFWMRLRVAFEDAEIVDLGICCALWVGAGRAMRVLDVGQSCSLELQTSTARS